MNYLEILLYKSRVVIFKFNISLIILLVFIWILYIIIIKGYTNIRIFKYINNKYKKFKYENILRKILNVLIVVVIALFLINLLTIIISVFYFETRLKHDIKNNLKIYEYFNGKITLIDDFYKDTLVNNIKKFKRGSINCGLPEPYTFKKYIEIKKIQMYCYYTIEFLPQKDKIYYIVYYYGCYNQYMLNKLSHMEPYFCVAYILPEEDKYNNKY